MRATRMRPCRIAGPDFRLVTVAGICSESNLKAGARTPVASLKTLAKTPTPTVHDLPLRSAFQVSPIHCGCARGASLHSRKNDYLLEVLFCECAACLRSVFTYFVS